MKRVLPLLLLFLGLGTAFSQDRCGFDAQQKQLFQKNPEKTQQHFENWLQKKTNERHALSLQGRTQAGPYKVPVVIHVIHNGEPIGTGSNISDAQIQSQIDVLNKDYQRLNADASNTPSLFQSVAGSIDLQFVLAKQDPDGLPTNGIVRKKGTKAGWNIDLNNNTDVEFKYQSYWPAEDYLNIWVVNITSSYIGFAQFPETTLPGLEGPYDRITDGVAVDYQTFGSVDYGNFSLDGQFNKGRTATHEIGHFFGLLHTFQDGCTGQNDFVSDTPALSEETTGCPSHPAASGCSGSTPKMFQNYLDYTDDACMNLFTNGQVTRMTTVIENSPRRKSLLTSHGLQAAVVLSLNLEALNVIAPESNTCGVATAPKVEVRNRGTTTVTSARVSFSLNGVVTETKNFTLNLTSFSTATLSFSPVTLAEPSTNAISYSISLVNGIADDKNSDNTVATVSTVKTPLTPPLVEAFNTTPANWTIQNFDSDITWTNTSAPAASGSNTSMYVNFYDYKAEAMKDHFISPFISLTQVTSATLKFDRAYARFQGKNTDSLRVRIYTDCQTDASSSVTLFNAGGTTLATASDTNFSFTPTGASHWKSEAIPLTDYLGKNIQIVFEATNGYGNNLFIDNVQIVSGVVNDVAMVNVLSPEPVICVTNPKPQITVQNLGSSKVTQLTITPVVNGQTKTAQTFSGLNLSSGTDLKLTLAAIPLQEGSNTVEFTVANPDVTSDQVPQNNKLNHTWVVNNATDRIPFRQPMEDLTGWTAFSTGTNWKNTNTNFEQSLLYPAFTNTTKSEKAMFVSPLLDFSGAIKASVLFDVSYGSRGDASENLSVLASEDCGVSYKQTLYTEGGDFLAIKDFENSWKPASEDDWRSKYINLNDYAGMEGIRLAFVVTNDNGNNLYLDNIEFFEDDDPSPPRISSLYSVYSSDTDPYDFKITFKLPEKETTRVQVYSILGQLIVDESLPETLNQTYTVNLNGQSSGIYIARLQLGSEISSFKLFVGK